MTNTQTKATTATKPVAKTAAKPVSAAKAAGKVAARNYFNQMLPLDGKLERRALAEAKNFRFTKEEAAKLIERARSSGKFTKVQSWKAKNGYSVFASVRPVAEVLKDRLAAGTIKPKAPKAEKAVKAAVKAEAKVAAQATA